ncbi:MAG: DUF998 domain-containing protein [Christensenellaceae bacterium]|nr:DUF998 domain-containing protein [Christensenellaceae bacterium]MDD6927081.1 hypothetical protein [bacterium]MDY2851214.1 hypothetical protein [Christensenellaceae bacterium]
MKKSLVQILGLTGIVSFLSYMAAVAFSPLAYPGYDWMKQAVSDLSAASSPSLPLWNSLTAFYNVCEVLCATVVCNRNRINFVCAHFFTSVAGGFTVARLFFMLLSIPSFLPKRNNAEAVKRRFLKNRPENF